MTNDLKKFLEQNKENIVQDWFEAAIKTYPEESYTFLSKEKNNFANPVGTTLKMSLASVFSEILKSVNKETIKNYIDSIMKIRAVQSFAPSNALSFILSLKNIIRKKLSKKFDLKDVIDELFAIESKIDEILFISFDSYSEMREKLNDIKANELKNSTYKAFEKAGLLKDLI